MRDIEKWLQEAAVKKPFGLDAFIKTGDTYGKRLGIDKELSKDELKLAQIQRKKFLECVWYACMREIKPQGFNPESTMLVIGSDLSSFYNVENKVDKYSPPKWRSAVIDWLIQSIWKNKKQWIDSRYERIVDKSGKETIKNLW